MQDIYDQQRAQMHVLSLAESDDIHLRTGNPFVVTPSDAQGDCALKNESGTVLR